MAVDFSSPSFRAAASDLTIAISPLGLVELSDEEFEVHGPRLNRYATSWAFYLGRHWSYRRELGEPQLTFNYTRAFSDFMTSFCFGRGASFKSPDSTAAIVPYLLQRVWEKDNRKDNVLWEMGNSGSVTGDCFVKIAYEEPYVTGMAPDPDTGEMVPIPGVANIEVPGKCRLIPINSAYCFPEFHPHDRNRIIRFKLKYRFWGSTPEGTRQVFTYVEILTDTEVSEYVNDSLIGTWPNMLGEIPVVHIRNLPISGSPWGMSDIADIMGLNREFNEKATDISDIINYHACVDEKTEALTRSGWKKYDDLEVGDEFLTLDPESDEIRWESVERINVYDYSGSLIHWDNRVDALTTPNHRWLAERRIGRPENKRYERQIVRTALAQDGEVAAGSLREGSRIILGGGVPTHFPTQAKYEDEFVETVGWFVTEGSLDPLPSGNWISFIHQSDLANVEFVRDIRRLQAYWRRLGATFTEQNPREDGVIGWYLGTNLTEALLDVAPEKSITPEFLTSLTYLQAKMLLKILVDGDGSRMESGREVWYQDDSGRRDGFQMLVAMVSGARTRSFLNNRGDGVVDIYQTRTIEILSTTHRARRVYYRGKVWCPTVPTGIWFARRNGVSYWTGNSPVTVLTGGRAADLEKGTKRVWSIPSKDAKVTNLEIAPEGIQMALEYLKQVKSGMHEMTGVPEGALGQAQAISNTSGVALAIQYMPLMMRNSLKRAQYSEGIEKINKIVLKTLYLKEPNSIFLDETQDVTPREDNLVMLDMHDQTSYENTVVFQSPLPVDKLVKLNELQLLMVLGLESKVGALMELGEEFPYEKLDELFKELVDDAERQGALDYLRAQIAAMTAQQTGMVPGQNGPEPVPPPPASGDGQKSAGGPNVNSGGAGVPQFGALPGVDITNPEDVKKMFQRVVSLAHGTVLANNQKPETDKND